MPSFVWKKETGVVRAENSSERASVGPDSVGQGSSEGVPERAKGRRTRRESFLRKKDLESSELAFWSPTRGLFPFHPLPHLLPLSSMTNDSDPSPTRSAISQASVIVGFRPSAGQMAPSTEGQPRSSQMTAELGQRQVPQIPPGLFFLFVFLAFPSFPFPLSYYN